MNYYEVGLGADRHWESSVFTYSSEDILPLGSIVRVPFGRSKKNGIVLKQTNKPSFVVKNIILSLNSIVKSPTLEFMKWYSDYYLSDMSHVYSQFVPQYLTVNKNIGNDKDLDIKNPPSLSTEQSRALDEIQSNSKPSVLHGITGSGKTRIYTNLILKTLSEGRNAILLYPEISLTPQIVSELSKYAPLYLTHSSLSNSDRSKLWHSIANNETPHIVVGPRSALFLPHKNIGLIIIDEAHESSYKQESDVHYNSLYVAAGLANTHKAKLLLGSATPPITETEYVLRNGGNLVCLHEKAIKNTDKSEIKDTHLIDAKKRDLFSKNPLMSNKLIEVIASSLKNNEQILLFLNRRGTAKLVLCSSDTCDWQATCPSCDLPMTYHHDLYALLCHTCGKKIKMPNSCPKCSSKTDMKSLGSKAIYEDIKSLFPEASIGRYDSDKSDKNSFIEDYEQIRTGEINILIGTQQIIKGLDLPKLTTIGILNADLSLNFPDFSSDERTFQLITQALGRVGRGHTKSKIVVQTFQPSSAIVNKALSEDWHAFKDAEIKSRAEHNFPPFNFYAKVVFRAKSEKQIIKKAELCKSDLSSNKNIVVEGPIPSFYAKRGDFYYYQLIVRSRSRNYLLQALKKCSKDTIIDLDPLTLL